MNRQQQQQQQESSSVHSHRIPQSRKNYYDFLLDVSIPTRDNEQQQQQQQQIQLPLDIYHQIVEFLPPFPLHGKVERQSRKCHLTAESCHTDAEGMIQARSRQALPHLQFFRFRSIGFQVGFGITTNPNGKGGIRLNAEGCGFLVSTKCFHFGSTKGKENITTLMDWLLRTHYRSTDNVMGIAVDYQRNQILMNWPNRQETLRLDLPPQFRNKILYPMVQVWGGSAITVLPERVMATDASLENHPVPSPILASEESTTTTATADTTTTAATNEETGDNSTTTEDNTTAAPVVTASHAPTTLSLTQSISQDSWCSEWMSLCKWRGLPPENHPRWACGTEDLALLKSHRRHYGEIPIVDELDERLPLSPTSISSLTSMTTLRTRRAASPHPHGKSYGERRRRRFHF